METETCSELRLSVQKDQLQQHEVYLNQVNSDLAEQTRQPPERGAKARVIQDYMEKEAYLQFEVFSRFSTISSLSGTTF